MYNGRASEIDKRRIIRFPASDSVLVWCFARLEASDFDDGPYAQEDLGALLSDTHVTIRPDVADRPDGERKVSGRSATTNKSVPGRGME